MSKICPSSANSICYGSVCHLIFSQHLFLIFCHPYFLYPMSFSSPSMIGMTHRWIWIWTYPACDSMGCPVNKKEGQLPSISQGWQSVLGALQKEHRHLWRELQCPALALHSPSSEMGACLRRCTAACFLAQFCRLSYFLDFCAAMRWCFFAWALAMLAKDKMDI